MADLAGVAIEGEVAIVTLDNPPVNALAAPLRAAAMDAIERALAAPEIKAIVLICAGRTFIAGADISELGRPIRQPSFETLFDRIETATKPIVAAIHGTALGGGFDFRRFGLIGAPPAPRRWGCPGSISASRPAPGVPRRCRD